MGYRNVQEKLENEVCIFLPADTIVGGILGFKTSFLTLDRGTKIFANSSSSSSNPSKMALLFTKELLPIENKKTGLFKFNQGKTS